MRVTLVWVSAPHDLGALPENDAERIDTETLRIVGR